MRRHDLLKSTSGAVAVVLVLALLIMVNWLGARHWLRADWTSSNLYTLSEKSTNVLSGLSEDVRVIVFMTPESGLFPQVRELLGRYEAASDHISVEYIDPDRERLKTQQLAEKFGVSVANTVVFTAGERSKYVTTDDMAEFDYSGAQYGQPPRLKAFKAEEEFTAAILSLVAPSVPKVGFVTGHGEPQLEPGGRTDPSLSKLVDSLKRENMDTKAISLLSGTVPADIDVLAIVGPTQAYTETEVAAITTYLDHGGRLLIALDPLIEATGGMRSTRLEPMLAKFGVSVGDDLVIDPTKKLPFYDLSAVYLDQYRPHPVTEGMQGLAVLFLIARSLSANDAPNVTVTPLVETSADGWGETNLAQLLKGDPVEKDDADIPGPVAVAMAVEGKAAEAPAAADQGNPSEAEKQEPPPDSGLRIVVLGDSDFMSDSEIGNAGNGVLAANAFNWLAAQEQALGIPPRDLKNTNLNLSASQMRVILAVVLVVIPGVAILLGILVWRRRRR